MAFSLADCLIQMRGLEPILRKSAYLLFICWAFSAFDPADIYLIDCGSQSNTTSYGRIFVPDSSVPRIMSAPQSLLANTSSNSGLSGNDSVLYRTARILINPSTYRFSISQQGMHWVRLYFFPFVYQNYDMKTFRFSVSMGDSVLIKDYQAENGSSVFKEFILNVTMDNLELRFIPSSNSSAFINALEIVSCPNDLITDDARVINSANPESGILNNPLETVYRVNMGGPFISPSNDTLTRTWIPDTRFLKSPGLASSVNFGSTVSYFDGGATEESAPNQVYATCRQMNVANVQNPNFNITWEFNVDTGYAYFVRLHFCDIVSSALSLLTFDVFINSWSAMHNFDISAAAGILAGPIYRDFLTTVAGEQNVIHVSIGPPSTNVDSPNAILNGLEILRVSNKEGLIPGISSRGLSKKSLAIIIGCVVAFVLIVLTAGICMICMRKKQKGYQHSRTWLPFSMTAGSKFSDATISTLSGLTVAGGFHFSLATILEATRNFDENSIIGVGGFGNVYEGVLRDGTKVAVKRGNPSSQQGLREFRTEIEMLTNFRHRHLVALIGYCDERNEMILVYEYMENGPLKKHLYGSDVPCLDWKQRLQICIGSARGLHYLHTGSVKPIIHRDVKSANILLDENFMAKVADFGLSKAGPELDQTHVSTAVKGSFGYLDPEYFRRQQLTEKSDVYSFGVVLLEVLCGRPVIDPTLPREMVSLPEWGLKWQKKGQLDQIMDANLSGQVRPDSLRKFGETIEKCLADCGVDRPTMGDVLWNLEYALQLQEALCENEDSTSGIAEIPTRVPVVTNVESMADNTEVPVDLDDLSGVSMRRVFSQLVKSEGR